MEELIEKYQVRIASLKSKQQYYEETGKAGACISLQGEIQAYNAVISDLNKVKTAVLQPAE